jgi:hypothetical protein
VQEDSAGNLWVVISVPNSVSEEVRTERGNMVRHGYDTVIEVIDPRAGRLVSSKRFAIDVKRTDMAVPGVIASVRVDSTSARIDVWRMRLERPPPRG